MRYSYASSEDFAKAKSEHAQAEGSAAEGSSGGGDSWGESFQFWKSGPSGAGKGAGSGVGLGLNAKGWPGDGGSPPTSPSGRKGGLSSGDEVVLPFDHDNSGNRVESSGQVLMAGHSRKMQSATTSDEVVPSFAVKSLSPVHIGNPEVNSPGGSPRGRVRPSSAPAGKRRGFGAEDGGGTPRDMQRVSRPSSARSARSSDRDRQSHAQRRPASATLHRGRGAAATSETSSPSSSSFDLSAASRGPPPMPQKVTPQMRATLQMSTAMGVPTRKTALLRPGSSFRGVAAPVAHGLTQTARTIHRTPTVEERQAALQQKRQRGFVLQAGGSKLHSEKFVVFGTRILGQNLATQDPHQSKMKRPNSAPLRRTSVGTAGGRQSGLYSGTSSYNSTF